MIGLTFAIYNWIFSQKKGTSAVYTGTLTIEYLSGNIIDFHLLFPIDEPSFDTVDNVYRNNFRVTNTGSLDGIVKVDLNILSNEFSNSSFLESTSLFILNFFFGVKYFFYINTNSFYLH